MIINSNNNTINPKHKDTKLWDVSKKFEAMLISNMLKEMQATVPKSEKGASGFSKDIHNTMFIQAIAEQVTKSPTLGIAESIYRQMAKDSTQKGDITKDETNGKNK